MNNRRLGGCPILLLLSVCTSRLDAMVVDSNYDLVVYGATSGGVMAAVSAARAGVSKILLIDPGNRIGGMSAGGLSATDVGKPQVIGGMANEFYLLNAKHYNPAATKPLYNLEPHVALAHFHALIAGAKNVTLVSGSPIDTATKSPRNNATIKTITLVNGDRYSATLFIDAGYEGDLMARAGVSYRVGRESASEYNESLNGYRKSNEGHEFSVAVDPFEAAGGQQAQAQAQQKQLQAQDQDQEQDQDQDQDRALPPKLLQMVRPFDESQSTPGQADKKVQSYNFRLCVTTNTSNQVAFVKPSGYDPSYWELARRYFTNPLIAPKVAAPCGNVAGYCGGAGPGNKHDLNNGGPISTDFVGGSWNFPDANYSEREAIFAAHKLYTQSFLWFMSTDPALDSRIHAAFKAYGLCADEFVDTGNWPPQLYIRAARRLSGESIFTQNTPNEQRVWGNASIGCGSYNFDSHTAERYACPNATACGIPGAGPEGAGSATPFAWMEGDVETAPGIYDIPLWVMLPKREEASNLLVVAAPSASHIGMSTLRLEPQFMIIGQSAGVVAALTLAGVEDGKPVHSVDTSALHAALLAGGQRMNAACNPPPAPPAPPTPPAPHAPGYTVAGAGSAECNGIYKYDPSQHRDPGVPFYTKDGDHQLYRLGGTWHIADSSVAVFYQVPGNGSTSPPRTGWMVGNGGKVPSPTVSMVAS